MRCPVLVGRSAESALLDRVLDATARGSGGAMLILGEAGVGKSKLAAWAADRADAAGLTVLRGRAVQAERPSGLRPLSEAVLGGLRRYGVPQQAELQPFRPALARLAPQFATPGGSGAASLVVLAESVLQLARLTGPGPGTLLLLEDLHWSDPETLSVVEYLADNLAREPLLLLATLRTEPAGPARELAESLRSRGVAETVELGRLDDAAVAEMIQACLGGLAVPSALDQLVVARAGGLPLLVEELLAGLRTRDALTRRDGAWTVTDRGATPVPRSFAEAVGERLRALPSVARQVLAVASVLGADFDWRLLPAITGLTEEQVLDSLRAALTEELIAAPDPGFRFRHALTREAVLDTLLAPERAELAARAAAAVVAQDRGVRGTDGRRTSYRGVRGNDGRHELAAELFELAGQPGRAADEWHAAARRNLQCGALISAETTLRRARDLTVGDRSRQLAVDETMVEVLSLAGETERALALGETLPSMMDGDPDRMLRTRLVLARAAVAAGRWPDAARQLAGGRVDDAAVWVLRAQTSMGESRLDDARTDALRALELADPQQHEIRCEALEVLGRVARLTDLAAAEAYFEQAHLIAHQHGLHLWRVRALHELGTIDLLDGRGDERRLLAARDAALAIGALGTAAVVDLQLNAVRVVTADFDGALAAILSCVDSSRRLRLPILPKALLHLAAIRGLLGQPAELEAAIEEARAAGPDDPEVPAGQFGHARFLLALWRAEDRRALDMLDQAMLVYRTNPALPTPFRGMWALLDTVLGDGAQARAEVRSGPQLTTRYNWVLLRYADAVALGRAGRAAEAEELLATVPADEPAGGFWLNQHALRLAATAALRDGWGEPIAWLRRALAWFDDHGQPYGAAACRTLLREAGVPVPRSGPATVEVPGRLRGLGVTAREMEVLRLVGSGLSNGEIAARLYLSPRTVETHVARLLRRTGAHGRAGLVALTVND